MVTLVGREKGASGRVEMNSLGLCPSFRDEGSLSFLGAVTGTGAGTFDDQNDQKNIPQIGFAHSASGASGPLSPFHASLESSDLGGAESFTATAEDDDAENNQNAIDEKLDNKKEVSRSGRTDNRFSEVDEKAVSFLGGKRGRSVGKRRNERFLLRKLSDSRKWSVQFLCCPPVARGRSSLILFMRQQTAFFLGKGAVVPTPALRGAVVGLGEAVRKTLKNSANTPESHGIDGPKLIIRNHRSQNDLSFAPLHTVGRELFLGSGPADSMISPSQQRYQRRASYPSDQ
jgi:hypothetical protein